MDIKYVFAEDIKSIHKFNIEHNGGDPDYNLETENKVEGVLAQQYGYFGHDEYPSVYDKSAMLLYFFTKGHCFLDGNKRVGASTMFYMFEINGYLETDVEYDWYDFTLDVAKSEYRQDDIRDYIRRIAELLRVKFIK